PFAPASYTLSLHDALPIFQLARLGSVLLLAGIAAGQSRCRTLNLADWSSGPGLWQLSHARCCTGSFAMTGFVAIMRSDMQFSCRDRKSTRLNSSHVAISYA